MTSTPPGGLWEATGVWVDEEVAENDRYLYLHFRAPDGRLYELVEERVKGR